MQIMVRNIGDAPTFDATRHCIKSLKNVDASSSGRARKRCCDCTLCIQFYSAWNLDRPQKLV